MKIAFHGKNASSFISGFQELLIGDHRIFVLPDDLQNDADLKKYSEADIIIGTHFNSSLPISQNLKLYQVPGAGYDGIDLNSLPAGTVMCNCFGHENAIAEYVFAALLNQYVPIVEADERLRKGDWYFQSGTDTGLRPELGSATLGIIGYGHIGKTLAQRAKAFGMRVIVANRSPVELSQFVDMSFGLNDLTSFASEAEIIVNSLPLTKETDGLVDAEIFSAMRKNALVVNVGRGPVFNEQALFEALKHNQIAGAIIDTWYNYPDSQNKNPQPSSLPFGELQNVIMTPHMSGWTSGTVNRRRQIMAENINRLENGEPLLNVVRPALRGRIG